MEKIITIKPNSSYKRVYKIRRVAPNIPSTEVTVPPEVVGRYASKEGITVEALRRDYKVEWLFNGFDGAFMRFVKDSDGK